MKSKEYVYSTVNSMAVRRGFILPEYQRKRPVIPVHGLNLDGSAKNNFASARLRVPRLFQILHPHTGCLQGCQLFRLGAVGERVAGKPQAQKRREAHRAFGVRFGRGD